MPTPRCSSTFSTSTGTSTGRSHPVCLWRCLFVCRSHCRHFVFCLCLRIGQDTRLLSSKTTEEAFGFGFPIYLHIVCVLFSLDRQRRVCSVPSHRGRHHRRLQRGVERAKCSKHDCFWGEFVMTLVAVLRSFLICRGRRLTWT